MKKHIYIKVLKKVDHSVFCVDQNQKTYYDPMFDRYCPYSSGAQIKRSILLDFFNRSGIDESPKVFNLSFTKNKKDKDGGGNGDEIKNGEVWNTCDPRDIDQLIGGYMIAKSKGKGKGKQKKDSEETQVLKRRSPLSISAMRPIHPLLSGTNMDAISFDRTMNKNSVVQFKDGDGNILDTDQVLRDNPDSNQLTARTFIPKRLKTATGYFVFDVAIDIEKLFTVLTKTIDPEVSTKILQELEESWEEVQTFEGRGLMLPSAERREEILDALIEAILNFKITSNQSRTYDPMKTLAVSICDDAQNVSYPIRTKVINEDSEKPSAKIIVDPNAPCNLYMTPFIEEISSAYEGSYDALSNAKEYAVSYIMKELEKLSKTAAETA